MACDQKKNLGCNFSKQNFRIKKLGRALYSDIQFTAFQCLHHFQAEHKFLGQKHFLGKSRKMVEINSYAVLSKLIKCHHKKNLLGQKLLRDGYEEAPPRTLLILLQIFDYYRLKYSEDF